MVLKNNIACYIVALVMLFLAVSCSNDNFAEHIGSALLRPQVSVDASAVAVDGSVSNTLVSPLPDVGDMRLEITNLQSGRKGYWSSVMDYPMDNSYLPGRYLVETAYGDSVTEGFDCPYFFASAVVDLTDGADVDVPLTAKLACCMIEMEFSDRFKSYFKSYSAVLHSKGGAYVDYPANENRAAFLHPGVVSVLLRLTMPESGQDVMFEAAQMPNALPGYAYVVSVDVSADCYDEPVVTVSFDSKVQTDDVSTVLTKDLVSSAAPQINCYGFSSGRPIEWMEGTVSSQPVVMSVSGTELRRAILTTRSDLLCKQGWTSGVDLLEATGAQMAAMQNLGLKIQRVNGVLTLDFSDVLSKLRYESGGKSTLFTLEAMNRFMKLGEPVSLEVVSLPSLL
ncbi:MAG: DUF4493 domain-containing protein [Paramuribaculum sp.]|nr:DUF4493 domain-containing protein [Paramuribaculum sp.]